MIYVPTINNFISRHAKLGAVAYAAALLTLAAMNALLIMDVAQQYHARNSSLEQLAQLKARLQIPAGSRLGDSPFLEGESETQASAALLKRLTAASAQAGANVLSSEVEPQANAKDGYLKAITTCELEEPALQRLLYDLEAGTPLLLVDQVLVQPANDGGKLRVVIGVSGLWPGARND
jgi:general secretion pathway protein M